MENKAFESFLDLITFDQSFHATEAEIKLLTEEQKDILLTSSALNQIIQKERAHVAALHKEVDARELEMKVLDGQGDVAKTRLSQVANEREYKAIKHEADGIKKKQHDYEAILLEVWGTYESAQKECEKKEKELQEKVSNGNKRLEEIKERLALLQEQLDLLLQERDKKEKSVPEEWLEKYSRMRNSVTNPVVLAVQGACSACFYSLLPQDAFMVKRGQLVQCKGCYRFIYSKTEEESK